MKKRTKSLLFKSWSMFTAWYAHIKNRFNSVKLVFLKRHISNESCHVVISY